MHDIDTINAIDSIDTLTACSPRVSPVKDFTDWHFQDESYFAGQQYYHPEKGISRHGVAGDPLPYLTSRDDSIGILLVIVFITGIIAFSFSRDMLLRQMKNFFYVPRRVAEMTVTVMETRSQYVLLLCTIANIATVCYLHYNHTTHESTLSFYPPLLIGLYALIIACSFLLRLFLYSVVNWVFFDKKKKRTVVTVMALPVNMRGCTHLPGHRIECICGHYGPGISSFLTFYSYFGQSSNFL